MRKFLFILVLGTKLFANWTQQKVAYPFSNEPIDVVIPAIEKDLPTLEACIQGIRKNCPQVRRVIVVSPRPLTDQAEWFNESAFPFHKRIISLLLAQGDQELHRYHLTHPQSPVGWYLQQLLKLYAPFVIPDISSNVLVLDADTIFLNPVEFLDSSYAGLYNFGTEYHKTYFQHAETLLPGLKKVFPQHSGVCHHMLFQKPVLDDLFFLVERHHKKPFWQVFCLSVPPKHVMKSGASEYEIYFNFLFTRTHQAKLRPLQWLNSTLPQSFESFIAEGYHYISCHSWIRSP